MPGQVYVSAYSSNMVYTKTGCQPRPIVNHTGMNVHAVILCRRHEPQWWEWGAIRSLVRGKMALGGASTMECVRRYECGVATSKASVMTVARVLWRPPSLGVQHYPLKPH